MRRPMGARPVNMVHVEGTTVVFNRCHSRCSSTDHGRSRVDGTAMAELPIGLQASVLLARCPRSRRHRFVAKDRHSCVQSLLLSR